MPTFKSETIQHLSGPKATEIARHINAAPGAISQSVSADLLSRSGIPGPRAIEIARQIKAGQGNAKILFEFCGMSIPDAAALAAAITAAGAK